MVQLDQQAIQEAIRMDHLATALAAKRRGFEVNRQRTRSYWIKRLIASSIGCFCLGVVSTNGVSDWWHSYEAEREQHAMFQNLSKPYEKLPAEPVANAPIPSGLLDQVKSIEPQATTPQILAKIPLPSTLPPALNKSVAVPVKVTPPASAVDPAKNTQTQATASASPSFLGAKTIAPSPPSPPTPAAAASNAAPPVVKQKFEVMSMATDDVLLIKVPGDNTIRSIKRGQLLPTGEVLIKIDVQARMAWTDKQSVLQVGQN